MEPQSGNKLGEMTFGGGVFVNVVSLKYIGMIYLNVCEMVFIPMKIHNEQLFVSSDGNTLRL